MSHILLTPMASPAAGFGVGLMALTRRRSSVFGRLLSLPSGRVDCLEAPDIWSALPWAYCGAVPRMQPRLSAQSTQYGGDANHSPQAASFGDCLRGSRWGLDQNFRPRSLRFLAKKVIRWSCAIMGVWLARSPRGSSLEVMGAIMSGDMVGQVTGDDWGAWAICWMQLSGSGCITWGRQLHGR